ncbi:MAG TPA: hypothetical protein VGW74_06880 [Propionibacteriaceae bacterium]|nr:hypothetical protein [Propionibacteriaceae bacterium]
MTELPEVERLQAMELRPGDIIVAKLAMREDADLAAALRGALEGEFPGHRVLVTWGVDIEVVRPEDADP